MVTREGKLFRYLQVRAKRRSQPLFSKLAQTVLCVRNDEPALMEFLVTVKNRREWVRVMMLSVTARSHTDRWREWRVSRKAVSGKHECCHITNLCTSVITPPNRNGLRRGHFSLINQSSIQFANKHNRCINKPKKEKKLKNEPISLSRLTHMVACEQFFRIQSLVDSSNHIASHVRFHTSSFPPYYICKCNTCYFRLKRSFELLEEMKDKLCLVDH